MTTRSPLWFAPARVTHRKAHPHTLLPSEEALKQFPTLNGAVRRFEPCNTHIGWGDTPAVSCRACGHTDFAHPGVHNPSANPICVVCALLITWLEMNS